MRLLVSMAHIYYLECCIVWVYCVLCMQLFQMLFSRVVDDEKGGCGYVEGGGKVYNQTKRLMGFKNWLMGFRERLEYRVV